MALGKVAVKIMASAMARGERAFLEGCLEGWAVSRDHAESRLLALATGLRRAWSASTIDSLDDETTWIARDLPPS